MPEAITIVEEQTPALSPENQEMLQALEQQPGADEAQLLAGKYKSVEELEKAYKELQTKLGQGAKPAPAAAEADEDDQQEAGDTEDQAEEPAGNAREIYGDYIGSRLEEANIDFNSMADRWSQSGKLEEGDYGQLEEAGFTRDMVDAYLAGLNFKAAQDSQLTVKEITSIKEEYGGEAQYNAMIQWAGSNLSKEEQDAFNQVVNTQPLNVARLAIAGLHARFTAAEGREPRLIGGKASKSTGEKFESTAQLVAAMSDPRYQSDPAFRAKVEDKLRRSAIM
jgi:hypothetical protein